MKNSKIADLCALVPEGVPALTLRGTSGIRHAGIPFLAKELEISHSCSQIAETTIASDANGSQPAEILTAADPASVHPSHPFAEFPKDFVTRLLPDSGARQPGVRGPSVQARRNGKAAGADRNATDNTTRPTLADLGVLYGGRDRLLRTNEVAERLGVSTAIVYELVEAGELPHIRIIDSIRVRPSDLTAFIERQFVDSDGSNQREPRCRR